MNELIWYSWLGGIIIGTMIGSNMVLEEVSRAGPRNVVITGGYNSLSIRGMIEIVLLFLIDANHAKMMFSIGSTFYVRLSRVFGSHIPMHLPLDKLLNSPD